MKKNTTLIFVAMLLNIAFYVPVFAGPHITITEQDSTTTQNSINTAGGNIKGTFETGTHKVEYAPKSLKNGVYIYQITAGEYCEVQKMIFMR